MSNRSIKDLVDIETERALLHALMVFDTQERDLVLLQIQEKVFYDEGHQVILQTIKKIEENPSVKLSLETVMMEIRTFSVKTAPSLTNVARSEPTPSPAYSFAILEEWNRKRKLYIGFSKGLDAVFEGSESSIVIGNEAIKDVDEAVLLTNNEFTTFADLRVKYENLKPLAKVATGVPFFDAKEKGGIEEGQFILLFGDQDAGKTMFGTQVLRRVSRNFKTIFFPFEFSSRSFYDHTKERYKGTFDENNLIVEEGSTDLFDIEAKLKLFVKQGGKLALIDSQMAVTNNSNKGTSEERETEKFRVFQRVCVQYGLRIILICQQAKEDTRSGIVSPAKSKNGGHFAHQIFKIEMPKVKYDDNGNIKNFGERDFVVYKNKQTGLYGKKPIHFDLRTLEFTGRSKDKEPVEVTFQDEHGKVTHREEYVPPQVEMPHVRT